MSWNEAVEFASRYTEASKSCLPEAFRSYLDLREVNRPVEERKSGTRLVISKTRYAVLKQDTSVGSCGMSYSCVLTSSGDGDACTCNNDDFALILERLY